MQPIPVVQNVLDEINEAFERVGITAGRRNAYVDAVHAGVEREQAYADMIAGLALTDEQALQLKLVESVV